MSFMKNKWSKYSLRVALLVLCSVSTVSYALDGQCVADLKATIQKKWQGMALFSGHIKIATSAPWDPSVGNGVINIDGSILQYACDLSGVVPDCAYGGNANLTACQETPNGFTISMANGTGSATVQVPATSSAKMTVLVTSMKASIGGVSPSSGSNETFTVMPWQHSLPKS